MQAHPGAAAAAFLLLLASTAVPAVPDQTAPGRVICILPPADLGPSGAGDSSVVAPVIARMVEITAAAAGFEVMPQSRWSEAAGGIPPLELARGPVALRVAARAGAELAVAGLLRRGAGGRLSVQLKGYDVAARRIVAAVSARSRGGLSLYAETQQAVDRLVAALQAAAPLVAAGDARASTPMTRVTLLSPDEGAVAYLGGEEEAGTVVAGAVTVQLPLGTVLDVELRKPGYHTARVSAGAEEEQEVPALVPETWWSAGVLLTADRLLGGGITARRYLRPDRLYAGLEEYLYKPFPDDRGRGLRNDLQVLLGAHLASSPGASGRVGVAAGIGVEVLNLAGDEPVLVDVYVNALSVGLELNTPRWLAFARVQAGYSLPLSDEEWAGTWRTWSPPDSPDWKLPPLTLGLVRKMR